LDISHTFVGDLVVSLTHNETGRGAYLVHRIGKPGTSNHGCSLDHFKSILDDDVSAWVEDQCSSNPAAVSGIYIPYEPLNIFDSESAAGNWTLSLSDRSDGDIGKLNSWCLAATVAKNYQPPNPPPIPELPSQAHVTGVRGQKQALPLDCESRVAVDWAAFFGVSIGEFEFFNKLPRSDNPDAGFVGSVTGTWGQIPPKSYGVYAEPVAALLRSYGLPAYAHRPLSWDALRAEIAAGRPVYVWVIGPASWNGIPVYYTSKDGHLTIVARYEHTVMVTGYNENSVTILDGDTLSTLPLAQFLSSWSALQNMAITTQP
jgi:subtilisin-like proprotein convertase family protein/uncharacterized protein YvpB